MDKSKPKGFPNTCDPRSAKHLHTLMQLLTKPLQQVNRIVKTLGEIEVDTILLGLDQTEGNRTRAAEFLGITRRGLIYKLKRLGMK